MRSSNPMLREDTFSSFRGAAGLSGTSGTVMTLQGTVFKTGVLLILAFGGAILTWKQPEQTRGLFLVGGMIGGLVSSLVCVFVPRFSPFLAPIYAVSEGFALGAISSFIEVRYPGVAMQALTATFGTLAALLTAYTTRLIRATENFKLGVVAATGGVMLMYLSTMILGFFGITMPYIHDNGPIGIGISLVVVVIAAMNLVLDFDFIETGAEQGAPKYMEWYGAFGLLVTLVWLYVEFLKLFMKLSKRD